MAAGYEFTCDTCDFTFEAWDDGNPYFLDGEGNKHYAYHPDADVERCIGNDAPHLCLTCGRIFKVDSAAPRERCNRCRSKRIVDAVDAEGHRCPRCRKGVIHADTSAGMIS